MQLTKKDFVEILKSELPQVLSDYGVVTKTELKQEIVASEKRTDLKLNSLRIEIKKDLTKLERSLAVKITKSKKDLAERIANLAVAKEERSKVEKIEKRVTTLENFQFA